MKLLVDVGVGTAVETWLRGEGHDVIAVRDPDARMRNEDILALGLAENRLIVTMDKDSGQMVYGSAGQHSAALLLRLDNATGSTKAAVVEEIFQNHGDQLPGRFSVYQRGHLRIRVARWWQPPGSTAALPDAQPG